MSFLTAELSAIHQPQSQLNHLQNSSQQNVTTIATGRYAEILCIMYIHINTERSRTKKCKEETLIFL